MERLHSRYCHIFTIIHPKNSMNSERNQKKKFQREGTTVAINEELKFSLFIWFTETNAAIHNWQKGFFFPVISIIMGFIPLREKRTAKRWFLSVNNSIPRSVTRVNGDLSLTHRKVQSKAKANFGIIFHFIVEDPKKLWREREILIKQMVFSFSHFLKICF